MNRLMLLLVFKKFSASDAEGIPRSADATISSFFRKERQLALSGQKSAQWPHSMQRPASLTSISGRPVSPTLTIPAGQTFTHVPHFVHFEGSTVIDGNDTTSLLLIVSDTVTIIPTSGEMLEKVTETTIRISVIRLIFLM